MVIAAATANSDSRTRGIDAPIRGPNVLGCQGSDDRSSPPVGAAERALLVNECLQTLKRQNSNLL
jgi:hypothetical protein